MKKILTALTLALLFSSATHAQSNVGQGQTTTAQGALKPEMNAASIAELEESKSLSAAVVKLYGEGQYNDALKPARRALAIRERLLEPDHELVINALGNLSSIYMSLNKYDEAEPLYQRLLPLYEKKFGADSPKLAQLLDVLAFLRYTQGDYKKAEAYYQRSLSLKEKISGPESLEAAQALYNLAEFYQVTNSFPKAEPMYQRAVAIREKLLGQFHPKTVEALDRYACLMRKTDRPKDADQLEARESDGPPLTAMEEEWLRRNPPEHGILNGRALSLPKPEYPTEAKYFHVSGTVAVRVTINEAGKVIRACALKGPASLWRASESAAARSIFTATKLKGQPVKVTGIITYNFVN
jgi:tetratricopeptide (TPR) repeat protein